MHTVYFHDQIEGAQRLYESPLDIVVANKAEDVDAALSLLEKYHKQGKFLAGYFSYELGYFFEKKLRGLLPKHHGGTPLLKFGVFDGYTNNALDQASEGHVLNLKPQWSEDEYALQFEKIMTYIRAGDVYQINLTFPLRGSYSGSTRGLYHSLKQAQPVHYGGFVSLGGDDILTFSPELFFEKKGETICMRPMKGTAARGEDTATDIAQAQVLKNDGKNCAENLMIVDLLRNDLSRISKPGSVKVTDLFSIETYPSLHTMTSGIRAQVLLDIKLSEILRAIFPCGSVTGAPKIRAMEIINELERESRGAYCGAIGFIDPNGDMRFNVAIRTMFLNKNGTCVYHVGSGVVADSKAEDEYAECLLKASFLQRSVSVKQEDFGLIESFGWHEACGFMYKNLHLKRLKFSASKFGFIHDERAIENTLLDAVQNLSGPHKIRLELSRDGKVLVSHQALKLLPKDAVVKVALSKTLRNSKNAYLGHKTTKRDFMEKELKQISDKTECEEVLFFNEKGALCEGCFTNVFVVKNGYMFTPPIACGLLPGVLRAVLIGGGQAHAKILYEKDLKTADEIYIGNSVRGLMKVCLV